MGWHAVPPGPLSSRSTGQVAAKERRVSEVHERGAQAKRWPGNDCAQLGADMVEECVKCASGLLPHFHICDLVSNAHVSQQLQIEPTCLAIAAI